MSIEITHTATKKLLRITFIVAKNLTLNEQFVFFCESI